MVKLPICFEASSAASIFRQVLDDMNLVYSRQNGTRRYTRFAAIVALEQSAFSYKYIIDNPSIRPRSKGSYSKVIDLKLKLIKESN